MFKEQYIYSVQRNCYILSPILCFFEGQKKFSATTFGYANLLSPSTLWGFGTAYQRVQLSLSRSLSSLATLDLLAIVDDMCVCVVEYLVSEYPPPLLPRYLSCFLHKDLHIYKGDGGRMRLKSFLLTLPLLHFIYVAKDLFSFHVRGDLG